MASSKSAKPEKSADKPKRPKTDWAAVERDYRTGKFSLRELEAKHGANNGLISRKAKRDGWSQDLSVAIRQATNAKLVEELVSKEVSESQRKVSGTVLAAAELNKQVILQHRGDIRATRDVAVDLLGELKESAMLIEHQDKLAEILAGEDPTPKQDLEARRLVTRALDLGNRVGSVKALAETFTKLQTAERKAFGLEDDAPPPPPGSDGAAISVALDFAAIRRRLEAA